MTAEPQVFPAAGGRRRPVRAVVVAVPVRDEERRVRACLRSVLAAADRVPLPVVVVVALDRCVDGSRAAAEAVLGDRPGTLVVDLGPASRRTVAEVRDAAVTAGLALARRRRPVATDELWVAGTDADTVVPPGWLVEQLRRADAGADLVAGAVDLDDDPDLDRAARERYARLVRPRDGGRGDEHGHVYGADLGVRASAWRAVGGFPRVASGEDAALLDAVAAGAPVQIPADADFETADAGPLQVAYAAAWTLVTSAARRAGPAAVTAWYRALATAPELGGVPAGAGPDRLETACQAALGRDWATVRGDWTADVTGGLAGWS